jgi:HEAT repeat protein
LAKIGDPHAIEPLIAALKGMDNTVARAAADALVGIGALAVEPLIAALKEPRLGLQDWYTRSVHLEAADVLVRIGTPAVVPLIAALKHSESDVRLDAAHALEKIGDVRAVEPLVIARKDSDSNVRLAARAALDKMGWRSSQDG